MTSGASGVASSDTVQRYHPDVPKDLTPNLPRDPDHLPDGDPMGRPEIMRVTGKTEGAVRKWFERGALPPPDGPIVWGLPTWRRRTVLAWALRAGHLDDSEFRREAQRFAERVPPERTRSIREWRELEPERDWVVGWEEES
jgi:hypothetical protein